MPWDPPLPGDVGSSPLTRGKLGERPLQRLNDRLIPAHAGKTVQAGMSCRFVRAHPRSRGENLCCPEGVECFGGSSPLTRGKP